MVVNHHDALTLGGVRLPDDAGCKGGALVGIAGFNEVYPGGVHVDGGLFSGLVEIQAVKLIAEYKR